MFSKNVGGADWSTRTSYILSSWIATAEMAVVELNPGPREGINGYNVHSTNLFLLLHSN